MKRTLQILALGLLVVAVAGTALAQSDRESRLRTVSGQVIDKEEAPISGAVVYLRNMKTNTIRTIISSDDGRYRFSGLDPNVDYEVHAEHKESTSSTRTVSSYDSRREIVIHLKVNKKKD